MATIKFRIEPDMRYCPQCRDEYRPGVAVCAACGVELLDGREMQALLDRKGGRQAGRAVAISPEDELVDILKGKIIDIKSVQALLSNEGIPSLIAGDASTCGKGCCGPEVRLQARMTDLPEVMAVLAREHVQATGLVDHDTSHADAVYDPGAGIATCPACGCSFSTQNQSCPDCGLCF